MEQASKFIIVGVGVLFILSAFFDWDWWYESRKLRLVVSMFGRTAARILYSVLGFFFICVGAAGILM